MMSATAGILLVIGLGLALVAIGAMVFEYDKEALLIASFVGLLFCVAIAHDVVDELNDPDKGVVVGKEFIPRHIVCVKTCITHPDSWYLILNDNGNVGDAEVQHSTYNNKQIGDYFGGSK
jgi:hypothetical protein